jgi:hypothetical protein
MQAKVSEQQVGFEATGHNHSGGVNGNDVLSPLTVNTTNLYATDIISGLMTTPTIIGGSTASSTLTLHSSSLFASSGLTLIGDESVLGSADTLVAVDQVAKSIYLFADYATKTAGLAIATSSTTLGVGNTTLGINSFSLTITDIEALFKTGSNITTLIDSSGGIDTIGTVESAMDFAVGGSHGITCSFIIDNASTGTVYFTGGIATQCVGPACNCSH